MDLPEVASAGLGVRWLGRVEYRDAVALQRQLRDHSTKDHLLLLEHDHVVTLSRRTPQDHLLVDVEAMGATVVDTDRGGDITYHGPGQLVGYPILTVPGKRGGGMADTAAYVDGIEQVLIDVLADLGVEVSMRDVVDLVVTAAAQRWGGGRPVDRADVAWRVPTTDLAPFTRGEGSGTPVGQQGVGHGEANPALSFAEQSDGTSVRLLGRLAEAGVSADPVRLKARKPEWMRVSLDTGPTYREIKKTMRDLDLVTVCEEAGCPNISECWNDGTATFMVLGERCTRACGFCHVDTRKPAMADPDEPVRVAEAVERMGLTHAVVTMVARDDLADGGAQHVADTVQAIRARVPDCRVEVLVSDFKGDDASLQVVFDARPDVFNHNIETVARLQRAVRPSASYARSMSVLARATQAGLVTKSSIIVGMGETDTEVVQTMADLAAIDCDIVTIGQYLRPTSHHLPVVTWWPPSVFGEWKQQGEAMGIDHVEASPLTRSSYHAREAADAAERG